MHKNTFLDPKNRSLNDSKLCECKFEFRLFLVKQLDLGLMAFKEHNSTLAKDACYN